jgi:Fanconi-associated nuclease 1
MLLSPQNDNILEMTQARPLLQLASVGYDEASPPAKRMKKDNIINPDDDSSRDSSEDFLVSKTSKVVRDEVPDSEDDGLSDLELTDYDSRPTELESALPPINTDKEAIAEYEAMRAAEEKSSTGDKFRLSSKSWTKGRSSIYVDAFNLALDTVLEDEGHLFDEAESEVFRQWRSMDYETQYLFVQRIHSFDIARLISRKICSPLLTENIYLAPYSRP